MDSNVENDSTDITSASSPLDPNAALFRQRIESRRSQQNKIENDLGGDFNPFTDKAPAFQPPRPSAPATSSSEDDAKGDRNARQEETETDQSPNQAAPPARRARFLSPDQNSEDRDEDDRKQQYEARERADNLMKMVSAATAVPKNPCPVGKRIVSERQRMSLAGLLRSSSDESLEVTPPQKQRPTGRLGYGTSTPADRSRKSLAVLRNLNVSIISSDTVKLSSTTQRSTVSSTTSTNHSTTSTNTTTKSSTLDTSHVSATVTDDTDSEQNVEDADRTVAGRDLRHSQTFDDQLSENDSELANADKASIDYDDDEYDLDSTRDLDRTVAGRDLRRSRSSDEQLTAENDSGLADIRKNAPNFEDDDSMDIDSDSVLSVQVHSDTDSSSRTADEQSSNEDEHVDETDSVRNNTAQLTNNNEGRKLRDRKAFKKEIHTTTEQKTKKRIKKKKANNVGQKRRYARGRARRSGTVWILSPMTLIAPTRTNGLRRSKRIRVRPLRFWLGERPIYKLHPGGGFSLVGVTEVRITDRMLINATKKNRETGKKQ